MSAEIANKFKVNVAPRQFAERLQELSDKDESQLAATVASFFYTTSNFKDGDGNKINLDDDSLIIPLPTRGGMSLMIRIRCKTNEFVILVLNPCQIAIERLATPLSDLLL